MPLTGQHQNQIEAQRVRFGKEEQRKRPFSLENQGKTAFFRCFALVEARGEGKNGEGRGAGEHGRTAERAERDFERDAECSHRRGPEQSQRDRGAGKTGSMDI